ncbi:transcriptional regulator, AraC family [Flavobacteriaceae bacterium MAR_2010_188]|nr:transcriptional regulator, AraC family [Flavobacteriaceae bacterium MAR_2010_188]
MKKIFVKFDLNFICRKILKDQLDILGIDYTVSGRGEVVFDTPLTLEQVAHLETEFALWGMELMDNGKSELVQRIKETIASMLENDESRRVKLSSYLSEKLNYSYAHLSNVFSETTYSSIENFLILKKIDHAKFLLLNEKLTLTEIADKLNYSSVAHLSSQFKKTTGLTPSSFQKLILKRSQVSRKFRVNQ